MGPRVIRGPCFLRNGSPAFEVSGQRNRMRGHPNEKEIDSLCWSFFSLFKTTGFAATLTSQGREAD